MIRALLRKLPWIMVAVFICSNLLVGGGRLPMWWRVIGTLSAMVLFCVLLTEKKEADAEKPGDA